MRRVLAYVVMTLIASTMMAERVVANSGDTSIHVSFEDQDQFVRERMRAIIGYDPLLEVIAGCESTGDPRRIQHWEEDGSLVKNPGSSASGALQVLLQYHSDWIEEEGRNMYEIDDYMRFVRTMRRERGYESWNESKSCWGAYAHLGTS